MKDSERIISRRRIIAGSSGFFEGDVRHGPTNLWPRSIHTHAHIHSGAHTHNATTIAYIHMCVVHTHAHDGKRLSTCCAARIVCPTTYTYTYIALPQCIQSSIRWCMVKPLRARKRPIGGRGREDSPVLEVGKCRRAPGSRKLTFTYQFFYFYNIYIFCVLFTLNYIYICTIFPSLDITMFTEHLCVSMTKLVDGKIKINTMM